MISSGLAILSGKLFQDAAQFKNDECEMMLDGRMAGQAAVMIVMASSLCFSPVSRGHTFYDTILPNYFGQSGLSSSIPLASSFSTGFQPIAVNAIRVNVQRNHGSDPLQVSLCPDKKGLPGSNCIAFDPDSSPSTSFAAVRYSHAPVNLTPYTSYWVKLTTTAPKSIPPPFAWGTALGSGAVQYASTGWVALGSAAFQMQILGSVVPILPDPPVGVTATAGDAQAAVSWSAPPTDGGSVITGYAVTASPGGSSCQADPSTMACTVADLSNGTQYTFTVTSSNVVGTSEPSQPSSAVIPSNFNVAGQCGTANEVVTSGEPAPATLCLIGQAADLTALPDGRYTWMCIGLGSGVPASCSTSNGSPNQATLSLVAKKSTLRINEMTTLIAVGGSGKGKIGFAVTESYGTRCGKVGKAGRKLTLKVSRDPGVCTITATKLSDGTYNLQQSNTVEIKVIP